MPDEDLRLRARRVTVVELGDGPRSERLDEGPVSAGPLRDRHADQDLALLADLGPLGDVAKAIEIQVRTR